METIREAQDAFPIEKVSWGKGFLKVIGRQVGQWSGVDDSFNLGEGGYQLIVVQLRLSNHLAQAPFGGLDHSFASTKFRCQRGTAVFPAD